MFLNLLNNKMIFVYITSFIFLIICILFSFTLYRLSKTTVNALVTNVNCDTQCDLTLSYAINNISVTKKLKTNNRNFKKDDIIPIFINPTNLDSPKYVPKYIYIILYVFIGVSAFGILFSLYFIINQSTSTPVALSLYK